MLGLVWEDALHDINDTSDIPNDSDQLQSQTLSINARNQFENLIRPAYLEIFNSYGINDFERLDAIEKDIRKSLLDIILQDSNISEESKTFIFSNKKELCSGKNELTMREAQKYFRHKHHDDNPDYDKTNQALICWAAYDRYSFTISPAEETDYELSEDTDDNFHLPEFDYAWQNLFVMPEQENQDLTVHSTIEITAKNLTLYDASFINRERAAYMFLISQSKEGAENDIIQTFIGTIAEIFRANNTTEQESHNPSCLPGSLNRFYFVAKKHPAFSQINPIREEFNRRHKVIENTFNELLKECFRQKIEKMINSKKADKAELFFNSLCLLRKETCVQVFNDENLLGLSGETTKYTKEMHALRDVFIFQHFNGIENKLEKMIRVKLGELHNHEKYFLCYLKFTLITSADMLDKLHQIYINLIPAEMTLKDLEEDLDLKIILERIKSERLAKQAKKEPAFPIEYKTIPTESVIFKKLVQLGYEQYQAAKKADAKALEGAIVPYHETAVVSYRAPKLG